MKRIAIMALAALLLAGCGEGSTGYDHVAEHDARQGHDPFVAEPRRVPKPKTCSDYANAHQVLLDERAGKLTKADKKWLDMDGDGSYCEESDVVWKDERAQ